MNSINMIKNKTYDYVIFYRPDLYIHQPLYMNKLNLEDNKLYYLTDYMIIMTYSDLNKFDNFMDKILLYDGLLIVENQLTSYLYKNFKVIQNLHLLGHSRNDMNENDIICHKPSDMTNFYLS